MPLRLLIHTVAICSGLMICGLPELVAGQQAAGQGIVVESTPASVRWSAEVTKAGTFAAPPYVAQQGSADTVYASLSASKVRVSAVCCLLSQRCSLRFLARPCNRTLQTAHRGRKQSSAALITRCGVCATMLDDAAVTTAPRTRLAAVCAQATCSITSETCRVVVKRLAASSSRTFQSLAKRTLSPFSMERKCPSSALCRGIRLLALSLTSILTSYGTLMARNASQEQTAHWS
jgi:hypothetical protein